MIRFGIIAALLFVTACAPIQMVRPASSNSDLYARLTPYYENTLSTRPRIKLLIHEVQTGGSYIDDLGSEVIWHGSQLDHEVFFASPVVDPIERMTLSKRAITETCPKTDLTGFADKIVITSETYMLFKNLYCLGIARR